MILTLKGYHHQNYSYSLIYHEMYSFIQKYVNAYFQEKNVSTCLHNKNITIRLHDEEAFTVASTRLVPTVMQFSPGMDGRHCNLQTGPPTPYANTVCVWVCLWCVTCVHVVMQRLGFPLTRLYRLDMMTEWNSFVRKISFGQQEIRYIHNQDSQNHDSESDHTPDGRITNSRILTTRILKT